MLFWLRLARWIREIVRDEVLTAAAVWLSELLSASFWESKLRVGGAAAMGHAPCCLAVLTKCTERRKRRKKPQRVLISTNSPVIQTFAQLTSAVSHEILTCNFLFRHPTSRNWGVLTLVTAHSGSVDKLLIYVYVLVSATLDFFLSIFFFIPRTHLKHFSTPWSSCWPLSAGRLLEK